MRPAFAVFLVFDAFAVYGRFDVQQRSNNGKGVTPMQTITDEVRNKLNAFWRQFGNVLYDTGFGDVVQQCGAWSAENGEDAALSCAYIKGAADTARLANDYMSAQWQICNLVGIAAGIFLTLLRAGETERVRLTDTAIDRLAFTYTAELKDLIEKKRAA